jgi:phosphatidylserine/phosphatidylglycerophosphate/cardiolipin synthase-like enzyme
MEMQFITNHLIYDTVIAGRVPGARKFVWLATSGLKDLYVHNGRCMVPFLEILADLAQSGVSLRLIHAGEPGPAFRKDFDRHPSLINGLERILCPRVHFKCVVVDGTFAYTGSANLTGAGMGAKSRQRRNFESGITTTDPGLIAQIMEQFDTIWMGKECGACGRKRFCADYRDLE